MSGFNSLERSVARLLSRAPFFKKLAKIFYSRASYLKHKKNYRFKGKGEVISFSENYESFFGYYDKSPANCNGLILGHLSNFRTEKIPSQRESIKVALFSENTGEKLWSDSTFSYNWQQGARLHWLDDDHFIYNDFDEESKRYVSIVVSSSKLGKVKSFGYPVQDSFGLDYFLSLDYRRLMALRPDYGYRNLPAMTESDLKRLHNDGIWRVDYVTGEGSLLISLADVCLTAKKPEFENAFHKANHVMISPGGAHFIFLHRYFIGKRRFDRLMLADAQTGNLKLLSDYGMVSHCFWVDDGTILGYMRGPQNKDSYWLVDIETGEFSRLSSLDGLGDGHPHSNGEWFVTDTYPDKSRMQHLLLCNWKTGEVQELGEFFHGFEFEGESRCDLHPRFSPDGKAVFFDSVFSGKRQLYRMELSN